jgi:4-hydroxy-3-polyprenylbenzoate decarboxylase
MGYRNLQQCVEDLERQGHLVRVDDPVDPYLEAAEIQRRVYRNGGPALLLTAPVNCRFPLLCNLFGTLDRARFLFRDTLETVKRLIELKLDPSHLLRQPARYWRTPWLAWSMRPRFRRQAAVLAHEIRCSELPRVQCWPDDGGAFITLPQVYTEDAAADGWQRSNLGMYRVQLSGGKYQTDREVGLHYQIHRGIGVHHAAAVRHHQPFRVNIFVGGAPAMTLAAVMPLPEGMSELTFAGALAGHRIPLTRQSAGLPVYAEADFCISGTVIPDKVLPEGPFGDHLGYYSLAHLFPVLRVERVTHRPHAIWPFTVVGRPPQEDTSFGALIHELTGPVIPTVVAGVHAVHAVDAAGVHPLLLAIGSERYTPYEKIEAPQELLTQANALLGQGQMSLAKYLLIICRDDDPDLSLHDIPAFFQHVLQRVDWKRDLHFQTQTTIDTLDYSGSGLNRGSKLVIAAVGSPRRRLPQYVPPDLRLPERFDNPRVCLPGVLALNGPAFQPAADGQDAEIQRFCRELQAVDAINAFPLVVICDDSEFVARDLNNFLWVVFTRSNPAADVHGLGAAVRQKHWGCEGSLVIDARQKPHHAPPLVEDPQVSRRIDALAARGGPLARYL